MAQRKKDGDHHKDGYYAWFIGEEFKSQAQYDSALKYFRLTRTSYADDPSNRASALNSLGIVYNYYKGTLDSSAFYYEQALTIYKELGDTSSIVITGINLAIIYKNRGWYDKSLETAFNALSIQDSKPADRTLASIYNTIASVYALTMDYPNALTYHKKALAVRIQIGYTAGIGHSYTNIGEVYLHQHAYDSALENLFRSEKIKRQSGDRSILGSSLNLIGEVYIQKNELTLAEPYLLEARTIKQATGEKLQEAIILNNLGLLELKSNDLKAADHFLTQAESLIRNASSLNDLRINLELKIQLHKRKGEMPTAFHYAEELLKVNDSLLNKDKAEALIAMQMQYETEKKEQQIQLLENNRRIQDIEINTKKLWINGLIIVMVVILVAIALIFYQYRLLRISKNKVELLLKEVHHRVKNNLQILSSLFSLQASNLTDENAIQMIKASESRVNAMAIIHRKLYAGNTSRTIDMKQYLSELMQYLAYSYNYKEYNGEMDLLCENIQIDVDKAIPLGLIINELVSNAMKYAYAEQSSPRLVVRLHQEDKKLEIKISDNGSGLKSPIEELSVKSFGLKMVTSLIKELRGSLKTKIENGTTFIIQIPNTSNT